MKEKTINLNGRDYIARDDGKIFSILQGFKHEMKPFYNPIGYARLTISVNGIGKKYYVHRIIAEAFIPNPNEYPCVDHLNSNPSITMQIISIG